MPKRNPDGEYKIEKGVSMASGRRSPKYPWPDMEPGDSIVVPLDGRPPHSRRATVHRSAITWAALNEPGAKYATRVVEGGIRIWRVR